jgi:outer membrane lipoprotein-sorting protein
MKRYAFAASLFWFSWAGSATQRADQVELLKRVDAKYIVANTVTMDVNKTDKLNALEQTKSSEGTLQMKKGMLRMELTSSESDKEKTVVVVDGKNLWLVSPPVKEAKNSKTQVAKTKLANKKAKSHLLLQILTDGGVFRFFQVEKSVEQDDMVVYFLKPEKTIQEIQKAQVLVDKTKQVISQFKYWDAMENETIYQFTNVEFDKSIKDSVFTYTPPKDAQVSEF